MVLFFLFHARLSSSVNINSVEEKIIRHCKRNKRFFLSTKTVSRLDESENNAFYSLVRNKGRTNPSVESYGRGNCESACTSHVLCKCFQNCIRYVVCAGCLNWPLFLLQQSKTRDQSYALEGEDVLQHYGAC